MSDYSHNADRYRKLTREQIRDALTRYQAGERLAAIAADHGVVRSAISYHVARHLVLRRDSVAANRRRAGPSP